jgi:hypothetical protein
MRDALQTIAILAVVAVMTFAGVGAVRWAKRGSPGTRLAASAMMLVLGLIGPTVKPPAQAIEEAREDKEKMDSESDIPPGL